jgi:class 3 adenylate cyclase/tetratricopeptide (TPR) repeat protein
MTDDPAAPAAGLRCPACGTPVVAGAQFCFHCGAPVTLPAGATAASERRVVTVLFGDLSDFTAWAEDLDPERVGLVADRALEVMSRAVTGVDGYVDKLTGDGIMAVFGAPTAHEDDPVRAVRAAAEMQSSVARLMEAETGGGRRLGLRVGLNTGPVISGVQAHRSYTVIGDTVNTAARLADAAGVGSVLAGRETALASVQTAVWRALQPLRLKGKREPVAAYELLGLRPAGQPKLGVRPEAAFVGRDAELGAIVGAFLGALDDASPRTVVVTGDAGIGKTRLVREVARRVTETPEARLLWGRARPYGEGRETAVLADWVRAAAGLPDSDPQAFPGAAFSGGEPPGDEEPKGDPADAVRERLARLVARAGDARPLGMPARAVVDRLATLLGLPGAAGPAESAAPGTGPPAGERLPEALARLLSGLAAAGPLLLVADDLQWADPATLSRLGAVLAGVRGPVLTAFVGRNDLLGADSAWWDRLPSVELIPLLPLDEPAAARLLRGYLDGADLEEPARQAVLARAQGNPFFLAELLNLLVDRGLLHRGPGGGWRLVGELPPELLPAGVQAVLAARIDTLPPGTRNVLRAAAVVGGSFPVAALGAAAGEPPDVVDEAVRELVDRGILAPAELATPGVYVLGHGLMGDVAYATIPKTERARRHAALACWAATELPAPRAERDAFVASHAERAVQLATEMRLPGDDPAQQQARRPGAEALFRLARTALEGEDNVRAEMLCSRSLAIAGDALPDSCPVLIARAAARTALRRIDEAEQDLGCALAEPPGPHRASALVVLGRIRRRRGDEKGAAEALVSALAAAADTGDDRATGDALRQLGLIDYLSGRLRAAEQHFRQALELAERIGDQRGAGWALQHLTSSAATLGDYPAAEAALARAAQLFADLDDTGGMAWSAGTEAFLRLMQFRLAEARQLAQALLPLAEAMSERWGVAACLTIDAVAAAEVGELGVARAEGATARQAFAELGDLWGEAFALAALAFAERGAGVPDEAVRLLGQARLLADQGDQPLVRALALTGIGFCELDRDRPDLARQAATEAIETLTALDVQPAVLVGPEVLLAEASRRLGDLPAALRLLGRAATVSDDPSLLFPRRQALAHFAEALLQAGDTAQALEVAERALAVPAEDVRSRVIALRVLADCLVRVGDRPAAVGALRLARAVCQVTEQVSERTATDAALRRLAGGWEPR